ncbi:hypothetical protein KFE25_002100 [Diacronema lutheri]|uniref:Uncharacterized protein n=2 Tax=Diacronema lutheri TaxID=2081491 RepID=A0A8J6CB99_DIALT|nr:hypothetical protein KFE25_002100 [Diacronema lutheri]
MAPVGSVNPITAARVKAGEIVTKAKELSVKVNTPPPPPIVFGCITLKRTPAQTPEDEPRVEPCQKFAMKLVLIPLALLVWAYGLLVWLVLNLVRVLLLPCIGPLFVQLMAMAALAKDRQALEEGAGCGYAVAKWWVLTYTWVLKECMTPLLRLWAW